MEVGLAAVVVHAQPAAAVHVAHVGAEGVQLDEDPAGLAQRVLDGADGRDLRADVEVQELQRVQHRHAAELLDRVHELAGGEAELRPVARGLHPLARALGGQARADADDGGDAEIAAGRDDGIHLGHAVHHDDDLAPELLGQHRRLDVGAVLVPVADDQRFRVLLQGERDQELRLAARLQAEVEGPAVFDQLLDDVALLVDLDRVDAAIAALVVVLGDGLLEGAAELLDARAEDVGEADEDREVQPALTEILDELLEVDRVRARSGGGDLNVAGVVDGEEVPAPSADVVQLERILDRPGPELRLQLCLPPPSRDGARRSLWVPGLQGSSGKVGRTLPTRGVS
jgi:hypothetical protein